MANKEKFPRSYAVDCLRKQGIINPPDSLINLKMVTLNILHEKKKQRDFNNRQIALQITLDKLSKLKME